MAKEVSRHGFATREAFLSPERVQSLLGHLAEADVRATRSRGVRNLAHRVQAISSLASWIIDQGLPAALLGGPTRLVRSILFDKVPGANWSIRWHQDVTIAVDERLDVPDYGPWSEKAGVVSVQPPASVLERIVSVRVHLDDCSRQNGALRVVPGSHRHGRLNARQRSEVLEAGPVVDCEVDAGGVLLMKPLLLHASSPSETPSHRRVVHLDFATGALDGGLQWSDRA